MNNETGITEQYQTVTPFQAEQMKRFDTVCTTLNKIEAQVNELHKIVFELLGGLAQAQNASGMQGMMARQLPDMSQHFTEGYGA